jgi:hypothetical protein
VVGDTDETDAAFGFELSHGGVEACGLEDLDALRHVEHHAVEIVRLQVLETFPRPLEKPFPGDVVFGQHLGGQEDLLAVPSFEHSADELVRTGIAFAGVDVVDAGIQHGAEHSEVLDIARG